MSSSIKVVSVSPLPRTSLTAILEGNFITLYYQAYDGKVRAEVHHIAPDKGIGRSPSAPLASSPLALYAPMAAVHFEGQSSVFYLNSQSTILRESVRPSDIEPHESVDVTTEPISWYNVQAAPFSQLASLALDDKGTWVYYQGQANNEILEIWNILDPKNPNRNNARFTRMSTALNPLMGTAIAATTIGAVGSFFYQSSDMSLREHNYNNGPWMDYLVIPPSTEIAPCTALAAAYLPSGMVFLYYLDSSNQIIELHRHNKSFKWIQTPLKVVAIPASNLAVVACASKKKLFVFYQEKIGKAISMYEYQPADHDKAFSALAV